MEARISYPTPLIFQLLKQVTIESEDARQSYKVEPPIPTSDPYPHSKKASIFIFMRTQK
jgi:hypothetical protein